MCCLFTCAQARAHASVLACRELFGVCCARVCVCASCARACTTGCVVAWSARVSARVLPVDVYATPRTHTQVCFLAVIYLVCAVCARVCFRRACMHCRVRLCMALLG
jgi:hypothetical protein